MMEPLRIVPAGAGSGKTHTIQTQLGQWVADGMVAPERIVAVTYTEAAAAELRERISASLLAMGRVEDALRLSHAYISTIHSLGLRLLTEFAFEAGTSPKPRLLNDDEQNALIRRALARTDKADRVVADLRSYGYSYVAATQSSGEEAFRDTLLAVAQLLRSIGIATPGNVRRQAEDAAQRIAGRYGQSYPETGQTRKLERCVKELLFAFNLSLEKDYGGSQKAIAEFKGDFRSLSQASRPGALDTDWLLWARLRKLRVTNRDLPLPAEYVTLARQVVGAADALKDHRGPLEHAQFHLSALLQAGQDVVEHYDHAKREAGLVDYTDMIAAAGQLLTDRPDVLDTLASRIDCLVVDEFQDTNPLQFALLWKIHEAGIPTLIVGDLKQAIMGFQGADPRLFEALDRNHKKVSSPLTRNWRSQPALMGFINAIGPGLFGKEYVALEAQRPSCPMAPLEVVEFEKNPRTQRHAVRAYSVGKRLKGLLADPSQTVVDRRTNAVRRLRGGDMAVLCPTNAVLAEYADVFRNLGLRVNHQSTGWLASRPVQLAGQALAYLANSADRHAALYLAVTELGSLSLEQGLQQLIDTGRIEDPLLRKLDALSEGVADRTIYALVADVLSAMELLDAVGSWPDGEQARANLLRLLGEAGEFMDSNREALAHGGYHGHGIHTFLSWLATRHDEDEQPDKSVLDEDAITLRTWHGAKGLEWPVVAVCNLDRQVKPRLPSLNLEYRSFENLSTIIENARIDYWPQFAASEQNQKQLAALREGVVTESKRLLYVALTRARDKLLIEWPEFQARQGSSSTISYWKLLKGRWSLDANAGKLVVADVPFACDVFQGESELPGDFEFDSGNGEASLPVVGRRAIRRATAPPDMTPDSVAASSLAADDQAAVPARLEVFQYGEGLHVDTGLSGTELGTYLHRCFEVLGSRPDLAERMTQVVGVVMDPIASTQIATAIAQFEDWLRKQFEIESMMREWPVLALDENGSVVSGEADLVVQTPKGAWVLDHKSGWTENPVGTFQKYRPQLDAYARALVAEGRTVLGTGLNLIRSGQVVLQRPAPGGPQSNRAC